MFRLICDNIELSRSDERQSALENARALSRETTREILVEAPRARFIYHKGELDEFWFELRNKA